MNRISNLIPFALCVSLLVVLASCAPSVKPTPPEEPPTAKLPPEKQNDLAMLDYEKMLDMTTERGKRNVLPELEESYREVIRKYPDAYLTQESYWRLIRLNMWDYEPPRIDEAERIREEFMQKYPNSRMINVIDDSMSRYYYTNRQWDRLLNVLKYQIRKFIETDMLESPLFMFFYAEAKYNLNDFVEAKKGYNILVNRFPGSHEARVAGDRLKELQTQNTTTDN
jgi:hypothetical protein